MRHRGSFRCLILGTALGIGLASCALTPVSVSDCSVRRVKDADVAFTADIESNDRRVADNVYVIVATDGLDSHEAKKGTQVQYDVPGPFATGVRTRRTVVAAHLPDLRERLGSIYECYVHAIDFAGGSHWEGPSPL